VLAAFTAGNIVVSNAPPVIDAIRFTPTSPRTNDTITVIAEGVEDPDDPGTPPQLSYRWLVGDTEASTTAQLPSSAFDKGDLVIVYVTATDNEGATAEADRSVTIINSAPVITDAYFTPTFPRTDSVITIEGTWADADDGDPIVPDVTWRRNGQELLGQNNLTLDGTLFPDLFSKGDTISASLRIGDGQQQSAPFAITGVEIVDAAPSEPVARVTPRWSVPGDRDLQCEVAVASEDPDGDVVTYEVLWYRDDVLYNGGGGLPAPTQTVWPGDTLPKGAVQAGETWRCELTSFSGIGAGATPGEPIRLSLEILQAPELVRGTWTVVRSFGDPGEVDVLGREVTTGEATLVAPVVP